MRKHSKKLPILSLTLVMALGLSVTAVAAERKQPETAGLPREAAKIAYASTQNVLVDGKSVEFLAYALKDENGNDTNYVKLRDVAQILNGSAAQFEVGWDGAISITTGDAYTPNGSELIQNFTGSQPYTVNTSPVKVNGEAVSLESITLTDATGGYTYFKLRDLGAALGFVVDWDPTDGITIQTGSEEEEGGAFTLPNGKPASDDNIREILYGLKESYPEGMRWINENSYTSSAMWLTGYGCAGFGLICSDAVFGDLPSAGRHSDFDAIRVGDMVRINHDTHTVVVLEKLADSIIVTEGNYNSSIHWGREISRSALEDSDFYVTTRYPQ